MNNQSDGGNSSSDEDEEYDAFDAEDLANDPEFVKMES
jgi:hypothetical protein